MACLGCKTDNICKVKDDFPELAEKVRHAGAVVVGGYPPYGVVDGFTNVQYVNRLMIETDERHIIITNTRKQNG